MDDFNQSSSCGAKHPASIDILWTITNVRCQVIILLYMVYDVHYFWHETILGIYIMPTEYILSVYIFYYYTYISLYKLYYIFLLRV